MLWLSEKDVRKLLEPHEVLEAVDSAFRSHSLGRTQMPSKIYLEFPTSGGDLRTMPAYLREINMAGVKIVNSHPHNSSKGLPTVMATMILNDPDTGSAIALISASALTDARTGAAGAVAARALSRRNSHRVGLIGCGGQAKTQIKYLSLVFPIKEVFVWSKDQKQAKAFCDKEKSFYSADFLACRKIEEAMDVDILVTTTPVRSPIVPAKFVNPGVHINAIGADAAGKQELDPEILKRAIVIVDDREQASHSGEVNVPLRKGQILPTSIHGTIGDVLIGKVKGRQKKDEITVFDSTGLAIQDVAVGSVVLRKARKKGIGKELLQK